MPETDIHTRYAKLMEEAKKASHGLWSENEFREWGKRALKVLDELCGVSNLYYTTFLKIHHEALVLGTGDIRFGTHLSLCISILRSVYKEHAGEKAAHG